MKIGKLIYMLFLLSIFASNPISAESRNSSKQIFDDTTYYGIVYQLYSEQSLLVISDMRVFYTKDSGFYDDTNVRISSIRQKLRAGTPVKFNIYQNKLGDELKDLQIISKREFDKSEAFGDKLE